MRSRLLVGLSGCAAMITGSAVHAAIFSMPTPAALDAAMGSPLLIVPGDGMPLGTVYGHPPSLTPGLPLPTPIGPMGFMPGHERISPGSPTSSGAFHALPIGGPGGIAGSDVVPPAGATAIDFYLASVPGTTHSFEITVVGTLSTHVIFLPGVTPGPPVYVGIGAFGETLVDISIVKSPFPSTTTMTWVVSDLRVLPTPGSLLLLGGGVLALRSRRR